MHENFYFVINPCLCKEATLCDSAACPSIGGGSSGSAPHWALSSSCSHCSSRPDLPTRPRLSCRPNLLSTRRMISTANQMSQSNLSPVTNRQSTLTRREFTLWWADMSGTPCTRTIQSSGKIFHTLIGYGNLCVNVEAANNPCMDVRTYVRM